MAQAKQIKEDIATNNDFKLLTRSYQEHAIGQINNARHSVLSSRDFSTSLEEVFGDVKTSYKNRLIKKDMKNLVKKNGRDVWVLLTANNKLYGDLIRKVCQYFSSRVKESNPEKVDLIIIGRQGKDFFEGMNLKRPYKYFAVPDVNVTADILKDICANFISYENVYVFYGKFENLVEQTPTVVSLSGNYAVDDKSANSQTTSIQNAQSEEELHKNTKQSFIFEPTIEEILIFFEKQILSLLLNQTVQEAQLGRFASRINAMEIAQNNIQKQLALLQHREKRFKNMQNNKKQLELLAGRALWNRG